MGAFGVDGITSIIIYFGCKECDIQCISPVLSLSVVRSLFCSLLNEILICASACSSRIPLGSEILIRPDDLKDTESQLY